MRKGKLLIGAMSAFVVSMAAIPTVFAETTPSTDLTNWGSLSTCLTAADVDTCTLGNFTGNTSGTIEINGTKTLDLNGQTITSNVAGALFSLRDNDKLTIAGGGTIEATQSGAGITIYGATAADAEAGSTNLTVEEDVTIQDATIMFMDNGGHNYSAQLDVYGTLINTGVGNNVVYIHGNVKDTTNAPVINIHDGANLDSRDDVIPFYLAGYGTTTIGKATVKGPSGIAIKAGNLNLNGSSVTASGEYDSGSPYSNGVNFTGAAIQIEANEDYAGQININITDDTSLTSVNGNAIQAYGNAEEQMVEGINLDGEGIILKSKEGMPILGVSEEIPELPQLLYNGDPIDLKNVTTTWKTETPVEPSNSGTNTGKGDESNTDIKNPKTHDEIVTYFILGGTSLVAVAGIGIYLSKRKLFN